MVEIKPRVWNGCSQGFSFRFVRFDSWVLVFVALGDLVFSLAVHWKGGVNVPMSLNHKEQYTIENAKFPVGSVII